MSLRRLTATFLASVCALSAVGATTASAASVGMPQAAAGSHYLGWNADIEATCLSSTTYAVTNGQQIDVYLPNALKQRSFYARPWMKVVTANGSRWVTQGWKSVARSDWNGYSIEFSWNVRGRQTDFYPAIELYFPQERVRTFSLAVTKPAGTMGSGGPQPCHMGG